MKILQVVEPGRDGVFRHVEGLIHFLLERGHEVSLAYSDRRPCDRLPILVDLVTKNGGATLNLNVGNAPSLQDIPALLGLNRLIRDGKYDVVHAHSSKAGGLARLLAIGRKSPAFFYTPHAYFAMDGRQGALPIFFRAIEWALSPTALTINVSEDEAAFAREKLGVSAKAQIVLPNPVDTEHFRPVSPEEKAAIRARFGIPKDAFVIGAIGRLSPQKNPQMLYRAFALALRQASDFHLFHLGEGDLEPEIDAICRENNLGASVTRAAYQPDPREFYQALDGLVMTSRFEGLSYAVLEALSTDLPVVLTDVPGNRDFFRMNLSHVEKCPTDDATACSQALLSMARKTVTDPIRNHRDIVLARFSPEVCFGQLVAQYQSSGKSDKVL